MIPKALANAVVILVSIVWASNFAASLFIPGYQPDSSINFVFMTIVGGALALRGEGTPMHRLANAKAPQPPDPPGGGRRE